MRDAERDERAGAHSPVGNTAETKLLYAVSMNTR
jgi:hypothetical protein